MLLVACGGKKVPVKLEVPRPEAPAIMPPQDRPAYFAEHWWDKMPFTDTAYIEKEVTLQAFSDFADVLRYVPLPLARKSADDMMNRAKVDSAMYAYFAKMSEDNFYHPNSPYRNDDVFAAVLENIIAWDGASELSKLRPRAQLATLLRNRVGDPASDFSIPGEDRRLYDIRSEYTLLFFSEHGCPICGLLTEDLEASDLVQRYVKGGKLSIVYVYPEEMLPADRELYDLRARPSMYLLGRDKRVLLKDASRAAQIEGYFEQL